MNNLMIFVASLTIFCNRIPQVSLDPIRNLQQNSSYIYRISKEINMATELFKQLSKVAAKPHKGQEQEFLNFTKNCSSCKMNKKLWPWRLQDTVWIANATLHYYSNLDCKAANYTQTVQAFTKILRLLESLGRLGRKYNEKKTRKISKKRACFRELCYPKPPDIDRNCSEFQNHFSIILHSVIHLFKKLGSHVLHHKTLHKMKF